MAWDLGLAQMLRDDLAELDITEQKMFGGLAFLWNGHMVCGVHKGGALFRVGKDHSAKAQSIQGVGPMMFTGRPMKSMVECSAEACADDQRRGQLMTMAMATVRALPPKA